MSNCSFELFDRKRSDWAYGAKFHGFPAWVMNGHWVAWVEHSGIMVTCVGTSFFFRSNEDRMQFVMAWT